MTPNKYRETSIAELEESGAIIGIQDGNHGEKHPTVADYVDEGIPFVMANDLNAGVVDTKTCHFITEETARRLRIGFSVSGDVLLTHKGTLGNVAIVEDAEPFIMLTPQVTYYRTDNKRLLNTFLAYAFRDPAFQARMRAGGDQGTRPYIGIRAQRRLRITFPEPAIQRRVADVLSAYDDLIENNRRRMGLLEETARLLYREWFVRRRFPGHEHTRITKGVPEGWRKKTAFDAMQVMSGGTPKTTNPDFWDGEIPFYTPKDSVDACYVLDTEKHVTELGLSQCNSKLYPKDTIFITARGTVGNLNLAQRPMAMNQSCYALAGREGIPQKFLFYALREAIQHFQQHASGAVFDAIIVDTFKLIPFVIPEAKLVGLFEETIEPMTQQIENLLLQNQKLRAARDLLLARLMSGEIAL